MQYHRLCAYLTADIRFASPSRYFHARYRPSYLLRLYRHQCGQPPFWLMECLIPVKIEFRIRKIHFRWWSLMMYEDINAQHYFTSARIMADHASILALKPERDNMKTLCTKKTNECRNGFYPYIECETWLWTCVIMLLVMILTVVFSAQHWV